MPEEDIKAFQSISTTERWRRILTAFLLPFLLILAVLGAIFWGIASPTEAAAVGALGATLLTIAASDNQTRFSLSVLREVMRETLIITSMVFTILLGATVFSLVFRLLGGDGYLIEILENAKLSPNAFLILVMITVFIAGFFIDFIEIVFIIVPVVAPLFNALGIDLVWIGILLALNLQTSFLTPPFGFALFYLKGVAPPQLSTPKLYRGIIPFIIIQLLVIALFILFPEWLNWWN